MEAAYGAWRGIVDAEDPHLQIPKYPILRYALGLVRCCASSSTDVELRFSVGREALPAGRGSILESDVTSLDACRGIRVGEDEHSDGEEAPVTPARRPLSEKYTPQSYDDALALTEFVKAFVAMLQRGPAAAWKPTNFLDARPAVSLSHARQKWKRHMFSPTPAEEMKLVSGLRVIKHDEKSQAVVLKLSDDCRELWWTPARRRAVTSIRLYSVGRAEVLDTPATSGAGDARFALAFSQSGDRAVFVFETVDCATKELLVDGLRLLVERDVSAFFNSDEFRVQARHSPR